MTGTKKKKRTPPKHLNNSERRGRRPARPSSRAEAARRLPDPSAERPGEAASVHSHTRERARAAHQTPANAEILYNKFLALAQHSHKLNQRRMNAGVVWLFVLPVILFIVRNLTDSSKIAFLIVWIVGMFLIAAFLVMVAYQDDELQKNLDEFQDYVPDIEEVQLGRLMLVSPESNKWISESAEQLLQRANAIIADSEEKEATVDA